MQGWIKLHRKIKEWQWYKNPQMVHLFLHLILSANHKPQNWQGIEVKRGQLITGRKRLGREIGISEQSCRTCLKKLKSTNEITIQPTNRFSLITICNYDTYNSDMDFPDNQPINQPANQQPTNNQPATNQQLTTNKNVKKEKNNTYTLQQIKDSSCLIGIDDKKAEKFYHHYNAQGWVFGNGQMVTDLSSALVKWRNKQYKFEGQTNDKKSFRPKLFPIHGKNCSEHGCTMPAVYKASGGAYDHWYCESHMPEKVREQYV